MHKHKVVKITDFAKLERALSMGYTVQYMLTPKIVLLSKFVASPLNPIGGSRTYGESELSTPIRNASLPF